MMFIKHCGVAHVCAHAQARHSTWMLQPLAAPRRPTFSAFQVSSSRRHVSRSRRYPACRGDSSLGHGQRPGPLRRVRRLDRSPAAQPGPGPGRSDARRRPRHLEQQRLIMERQTRRRSHRQISTHLPRCRWPPAPRLARQASRPTRLSPAMGRWTRVERPRRRPKAPRPRSGKARGSAPTPTPWRLRTWGTSPPAITMPGSRRRL